MDPNWTCISYWKWGYSSQLCCLKMGITPFISHETAVWKGSHNPRYKGLRITMVIDHLLNETNCLPLKIGHPERKRLYSKHPFSGINSLLVYQRVFSLFFFCFPPWNRCLPSVTAKFFAFQRPTATRRTKTTRREKTDLGLHYNTLPPQKNWHSTWHLANWLFSGWKLIVFGWSTWKR